MPPQKAATLKATRKSTRKATQKSTAQKSTQKSCGEGTKSPPDDKGNWYNLWEALVGSANGNTNTIRGSGNHIILIGNDNKNELDGSKNIVAEHGARNENKSKGDLNKIGLKGKGISHAPEESINKRVIYLTDCLKPKKRPTSGDQQGGNKRGENENAWLEEIRRMCEEYLPKGYNWNEFL